MYVTKASFFDADLYKNGIQRASFLPAIALIKEKLHVHSLNSGIDYRKQKKKSFKAFFSPLDGDTHKSIDSIWSNLRRGKEVKSVELQFLGRSLRVPEAADGVAKISFAQLCGQAHSAVDYLELVKNFKTLILTDIPKMTLSHRAEARRFITLLDAIYENRTKLIASAEAGMAEIFSVEPRDDDDEIMGSWGTASEGASEGLLDDSEPDLLQSPLFTGAEEVFAFNRAVSRLNEMQSAQWLGDELIEVLRQA
ncbi:hypothetical protein HK102_013755 [Quaeritorhiza haematococci]|nr:hypothetical protein HK102_013755 [Quaeritorhiza haematococci]